jgi:ubiquinone/menaquinone biosynthesis C-methylase UbiE
MNPASPEDIKAEVKRLTEQALCWEPDAEILFDKIGIQPGWKCIDLGCGPLGVLSPLSRCVGSQGQVLGLDINPFYIQEANCFINENHYTNVKLIVGDIYDIPIRLHSFDLSHMRFVFTQKGCDEELLGKMIALTKHGGVIISQESDMTTWNCYPPQLAWNKMRKSLSDLFELLGGDINAGLRTYQMFRKANLEDIQIRTASLAMPVGHAYRAGLLWFALAMQEKITAANILTENEFEDALDECNVIINNPEIIIFSYTVCQVWGCVKPPVH